MKYQSCETRPRERATRPGELTCHLTTDMSLLKVLRSRFKLKTLTFVLPSSTEVLSVNSHASQSLGKSLLKNNGSGNELKNGDFMKYLSTISPNSFQLGCAHYPSEITVCITPDALLIP